MINRSSAEILSQIIEASNYAASRLEEAQKKGNAEEVEKLKKIILDSQKKIAEMLK